MNVGHLILHPRTKGNKQKRQCPITQKTQYSPNQKRQSTTHSSLYLIEKNALCLYNSQKGAVLLALSSLSPSVWETCKSGFTRDRSPPCPYKRTCRSKDAQRAGVHGACPTGSLQLHQGSHADGKLAGGDPCCVYICPGMLHFQRHNDTAVESLPVNETFSHSEQLGY